MLIGVTFPQTEIGDDPAVIRDYAQAVEGTGYRQILAYDHVLGASTRNRPDWTGPYTDKTVFHEIFVLFGYLAALTQRVDLVAGVLVLPLRQTALVAKQAASIDLFSGGRLRLGVGVGWNAVEFEAMGEDFKTRGRRIEEQIEVLRLLWTEPVVDYTGRWHRINDAGLNPLPPQRPIPVWIGGTADAVLERTARLADGWIPLMQHGQKAEEVVSKLRGYMDAAGRDFSTLGFEARLNLRIGGPDEWRQHAEAWRALGATHMDITTMGMGLSGREHIDLITRVWDEMGLADFADYRPARLA
jgi:probable F420-dependent oxidoreductase